MVTRSYLVFLAVLALAVFAAFIVYQSPDTEEDIKHSPVILEGIPSEQHVDMQSKFSIWYPQTATVSYSGFDGYLPATGKPAVSVVLPEELGDGTNLLDAGVYVGVSTDPARVASCEKALEEFGETASERRLLGEDSFAVFASKDAAAGNLYDSTSYRIARNGMCYEIVEVIHSGNIGNYPEGAVTEFDRNRVLELLDSILRTFQFEA